jgi:hypothetical protein
MILGPKGRHQIAGHKGVVWNRLSISRPEGSPLISIPQITLIIFDLVLFTKLEKFILESPFLMMMLLLLEVIDHAVLFRFTDAEGVISFLPGKCSSTRTGLINPPRGI